MKKIFLLPIIFVAVISFAQTKPYYYQIPDTSAAYTAATVMARLIDGLGFRYFWATEGLKETDMDFRPSKDARSTQQTLQHIENLTRMVLNAISKQSTNFSTFANDKLSFAELRRQTLEQIRAASEILKQPNIKLDEMDILFEGDNQKREFSSWNLINGPISDALWHVGQVVSFRRSSGNPIPEGVEVLTGTKTDP